MKTAILAAMLALLWAASAAAHSTLKPEETADLAFAQHPGASLPLDAPLRDEAGRALRLGDLVSSRPTVLVLDYLHCETLCGVVLDKLARTLDRVPLDAGKDFAVLAVSIDPRDGPAEAQAAKRHYLDLYRYDGAAAGWHFLTGDRAAIDRIADAVGFPYRYDAAIDQFAHPAGIVLVAPGGTVSRYILGLDYTPLDVRLGLVEAAHGTVSAPAAGFLLLCYHYDPQTGRYTASVVNAMRVAGGLTVLGIAGLLVGLGRSRRG
jgi:protein SCO1/2